MNIRYSLLPYTYTLFHKAHQAGETVLRALAWEFPDDEDIKAVDNSFMSGPSLLVMPVLAPLATTVQGVLPGIAAGTVWYDWYTFNKIDASPGENKTFDAPLLHQPIFIRGGSIIPVQKAGNTTSTSRTHPWSLIIALDQNGEASGDLYLDDGVSLVQQATKSVKVSGDSIVIQGKRTDINQFTFSNNTFTAQVTGNYKDTNPLANITIAGYTSNASIDTSGSSCDTSQANFAVHNGTLYITNLQSATPNGAWSQDTSIVIALNN